MRIFYLQYGFPFTYEFTIFGPSRTILFRKTLAASDETIQINYLRSLELNLEFAIPYHSGLRDQTPERTYHAVR
jgi:hypothetical protein